LIPVKIFAALRAIFSKRLVIQFREGFSVLAPTKTQHSLRWICPVLVYLSVVTCAAFMICDRYGLTICPNVNVRFSAQRLWFCALSEAFYRASILSSGTIRRLSRCTRRTGSKVPWCWSRHGDTGIGMPTASAISPSSIPINWLSWTRNEILLRWSALCYDASRLCLDIHDSMLAESERQLRASSRNETTELPSSRATFLMRSINTYLLKSFNITNSLRENGPEPIRKLWQRRSDWMSTQSSPQRSNGRRKLFLKSSIQTPKCIVAAAACLLHDARNTDAPQKMDSHDFDIGGQKVHIMVYNSSCFDSSSYSLVSSDGELDAFSFGIFHLTFSLSELEISLSQKNNVHVRFDFR
jgi:hypothetical protein